MTASNQLSQLMTALPQELYDTIYDLTFTITPAIIHLARDYKPPNMLQIDSQSRKRLAQAYYTNITVRCIKLKQLANFVCSLSEEHLALLKNRGTCQYRCDSDYNGGMDPGHAFMVIHNCVSPWETHSACESLRVAGMTRDRHVMFDPRFPHRRSIM